MCYVFDKTPLANHGCLPWGNKAYLFIYRHRIVGCLVVEPIRSAHRVISNSDEQPYSDVSVCKKNKLNAAILQFGLIKFQQEVIKKLPSSNISNRVDMVDEGAILNEKEAVPATCGIRAIWFCHLAEGSALLKSHLFWKGVGDEILSYRLLLDLYGRKSKLLELWPCPDFSIAVVTHL
ncbi:hypothetical protein ACLOJK_025610 [Asimina triloba]